jgi:hypothetical protein
MNNEIQTIRKWLALFMAALILSGVTALPLERELNFVIRNFPFEGSIRGWFEEIRLAVQQTSKNYPFLFYSYDWLAFAHFILAILFIGPYRNPVKNKWVIEFGIIACLLVLPFAFIAGSYRGMPFWWQLIDCSFGIIGLVPLVIVLRKIKRLETEEKMEAEKKQGYELLVA